MKIALGVVPHVDKAHAIDVEAPNRTLCQGHLRYVVPASTCQNLTTRLRKAKGQNNASVDELSATNDAAGCGGRLVLHDLWTILRGRLLTCQQYPARLKVRSAGSYFPPFTN